MITAPSAYQATASRADCRSRWAIVAAVPMAAEAARAAKGTTGQRRAAPAPANPAGRRPDATIQMPPAIADSVVAATGSNRLSAIRKGPNASHAVIASSGRRTTSGTTTPASSSPVPKRRERAAAAVNVAVQRRQEASSRSKNSVSFMLEIPLEPVIQTSREEGLPFR